MAAHEDSTISADELYTLSLPFKPGIDKSSKMLLKTDEMKDIIIKSVICGDIIGSTYHSGPTEFNNGKFADITYYPNDSTKNLSSLIVEIQKRFHMSLSFA